MSIALLARSATAVLSDYADHSVERVAVGAVIVRNGATGPEVLVLRRRHDEEYGTIEELPSGAVEPGESLADAAHREAAEETSVHLGIIDKFAFTFVYPSSKGLTVQINFVATVPFDVPVRLNPAEHVAWRWLPVDHLAESDLTANVRDGLHQYFFGSAPRRFLRR